MPLSPVATHREHPQGFRCEIGIAKRGPDDGTVHTDASGGVCRASAWLALRLCGARAPGLAWRRSGISEARWAATALQQRQPRSVGNGSAGASGQQGERGPDPGPLSCQGVEHHPSGTTCAGLTVLCRGACVMPVTFREEHMQITHRITIEPISRGARGERYRATYAGAVLIESSRSPEFDACRALLAQGITGKMQVWWRGGSSFPAMTLDIERGAELTVEETDQRGLRLVPYRPFSGELHAGCHFPRCGQRQDRRRCFGRTIPARCDNRRVTKPRNGKDSKWILTTPINHTALPTTWPASTIRRASQQDLGRAREDRRGPRCDWPAKRERGSAGVFRSQWPALQRQERPRDASPAVARRCIARASECHLTRWHIFAGGPGMRGSPSPSPGFD